MLENISIILLGFSIVILILWCDAQDKKLREVSKKIDELSGDNIIEK